MIGRRILPEAYKAWNAKWGAPTGFSRGVPPRLGGTAWGVRRRGPFAWQENSPTRLFEFPWAYEQVSAAGSSLDVIEVGGGLSGLQFVLGAEGHSVVNVDPGQPEQGWKYSAAGHATLVKAFGAKVVLFPGTAGTYMPARKADVLMCVSAMEHFPPAAIDELAQAIPRLVRSGGRVVLTVDLFIDLHPFCGRGSNRWGANLDIAEFLKKAGLELQHGHPEELYGFDGFDPRRVLEHLSEYRMGEYPVVAQCLVAQLP